MVLGTHGGVNGDAFGGNYFVGLECDATCGRRGDGTDHAALDPHCRGDRVGWHNLFQRDGGGAGTHETRSGEPRKVRADAFAALSCAGAVCGGDYVAGGVSLLHDLCAERRGERGKSVAGVAMDWNLVRVLVRGVRHFHGRNSIGKTFRAGVEFACADFGGRRGVGKFGVGGGTGDEQSDVVHQRRRRNRNGNVFGGMGTCVALPEKIDPMDARVGGTGYADASGSCEGAANAGPDNGDWMLADNSAAVLHGSVESLSAFFRAVIHAEEKTVTCWLRNAIETVA